MYGMSRVSVFVGEQGSETFEAISAIVQREALLTGVVFGKKGRESFPHLPHNVKFREFRRDAVVGYIESRTVALQLDSKIPPEFVVLEDTFFSSRLDKATYALPLVAQAERLNIRLIVSTPVFPIIRSDFVGELRKVAHSIFLHNTITESSLGMDEAYRAVQPFAVVDNIDHLKRLLDEASAWFVVRLPAAETSFWSPEELPSPSEKPEPKYFDVQAHSLFDGRVYFACPFCKMEEHSYASGTEASRNRIETHSSPHCHPYWFPVGFSGFAVHVTDKTIKRKSSRLWNERRRSSHIVSVDS